MTGFLARACAEARDRVVAARDAEPLAALRARAADCAPPPGFAVALATGAVAVVAEIKRASPSRGHMADIPDPAALASRYADGGAAAVSVLTEPRHFSGSLDDLVAVAARVDLPVLRKDFVVDGYQVWEAAAAGASAVLLIVAGLEQDALVALLSEAADAGIDALVETHAEHEIARAAGAHERAGTPRPLVLGVNARDLATLSVDPGRFAALRAAVPPGAITVAESGIRDADDVRRLAGQGADAVLVGESVATAADPAAAVRALVAAGRSAQKQGVTS